MSFNYLDKKKSTGRPKKSKTDTTGPKVKIGSRYVERGSEEHQKYLKKSRENVKNCRQRKPKKLTGEAQCIYCQEFFKQRGLKTHQEKCPSKNLVEKCELCGNVFKKYGITNHKKTCLTMKNKSHCGSVPFQADFLAAINAPIAYELID